MGAELKPDESFNPVSANSGVSTPGLTGSEQNLNPDSSLDRKFWLAIALFVILAALAWFTLGEGTVLVNGHPVEIRLLPVVVLGGFALRTMLARQADRIRRRG